MCVSGGWSARQHLITNNSVTEEALLNIHYHRHHLRFNKHVPCFGWTWVSWFLVGFLCPVGTDFWWSDALPVTRNQQCQGTERNWEHWSKPSRIHPLASSFLCPPPGLQNFALAWLVCITWGLDPHRKGHFEGMTSGFSHTLLSTVPSGRDSGISPHAVDQCSSWPAADAVRCYVIFPQEKIPLWCSLSSEFCNRLLSSLWGNDGGGPLINPVGVAPSQMIIVAASVVFLCTIKVQKKIFFWHRLTRVVPEKGRKMVMCVCVCVCVCCYHRYSERTSVWNTCVAVKHWVRVCGHWWPNKFWRTPWRHRTPSSADLSWYQNCCQYLYQCRQTRLLCCFWQMTCNTRILLNIWIFVFWNIMHCSYLMHYFSLVCDFLCSIFITLKYCKARYNEGSMHKGSISVYFRFSFFYTVRQFLMSPTSMWHQCF